LLRDRHWQDRASVENLTASGAELRPLARGALRSMAIRIVAEALNIVRQQ